MCSVLLPPGVNPIAVEKYIISYHISYHIIILETTEITVSAVSYVLYGHSDVETV